MPIYNQEQFVTPTTTVPALGTRTDTSALVRSLLAQISSARRAPLIPQDNQMLLLSAALSGFGAGFKGQPNPVLKSLTDLRGGELDLLAKEGTLHLGLLGEERQEKQAQAQLSVSQNKLLSGMAKDLIDRKSKEGKTAGLGIINRMLGGLLPPNVIEKMASDDLFYSMSSEQLKVALATAIVEPNDPNVPEPLRKMSREALEGAADAFGIKDRSLFLADRAGKLAKAKLEEVKSSSDPLVSLSGMFASGQIDDLAVHRTLINAAQSKNPELLAYTAKALAERGVKIPPAIAEIVALHDRKTKLELSSGEALERLRISEKAVMDETVKALKQFPRDTSSLIGHVKWLKETITFGQMLKKDTTQVQALLNRVIGIIEGRTGGPLPSETSPEDISKQILDRLRQQGMLD